MNTTSPAALAIAGITVFMATVISIWQAGGVCGEGVSIAFF